MKALFKIVLDLNFTSNEAEQKTKWPKIKANLKRGGLNDAAIEAFWHMMKTSSATHYHFRLIISAHPIRNMNQELIKHFKGSEGTSVGPIKHDFCEINWGGGEPGGGVD